MYGYDYDGEPDASFCNAELYSAADCGDDSEMLEIPFAPVTRLQRFWLNFRWFTLPVWGVAVRGWHRYKSMRYRNLPDDIPF